MFGCTSHYYNFPAYITRTINSANHTVTYTNIQELITDDVITLHPELSISAEDSGITTILLVMLTVI